jgi:hypothetical protein
MHISVSPSFYTAIKAESESLKLGFALGVDALLSQLIAVQTPPKEAPNGNTQSDPDSK